ncbi:YhhN-like protein [Tenacibaculum sp. MAR_2009_124]|uniref:lysoplasmalogenase family protein n=1 Tax=Tenacibaculum sp. MAR_2009_124 TaxID=1250059 RepID=UPI00089B088A|nr:YhhN-like protein [Tenacibaculum sp. MAR_2009_124]
MVLREKKFAILYFIASVLSLVFIDNDSIIELVLKLLSLTFLSFMYLNRSRVINIWYLLVLLFSIASDAFLIFDTDLLFIGSMLLIINRFLYIIIARRAIFQTKLHLLIFYLVLCLLLFVVIYIILRPYLKEILGIFMTMGFSSCVMLLFAYLNYLNRMNRRNKYFLFGLFLIITADVLMIFNKFLDYNILYVIAYTSIYYVARYLICESMIVGKPRRRR